MSGPEGGRYGTIVVVGGGCYGAYYVRQLGRAARAGALAWRRLIVVDRDPACAVASAQPAAGEALPAGAPAAEVVVEDWRAFFRAYLAAAAADRAGSAADAIVPSPLMPHLMFEWVRERARQQWPERLVETRPLETPPPTPWERSAPDGTHYVSFAEWTCPINCVEPRTCPAVRAPRTWSLPPVIRRFAADEAVEGSPVLGPAIFHCTHRAYGVGMFDTREVLAADDLVRTAAERGAAEVLIGTMSHCHGALNRLVVGPPVEAGFAAAPLR